MSPLLGKSPLPASTVYRLGAELESQADRSAGCRKEAGGRQPADRVFRQWSLELIAAAGLRMPAGWKPGMSSRSPRLTIKKQGIYGNQWGING